MGVWGGGGWGGGGGTGGRRQQRQWQVASGKAKASGKVAKGNVDGKGAGAGIVGIVHHEQFADSSEERGASSGGWRGGQTRGDRCY